jgi:DNA-binding Lrp family transcriptional regulator
VPVTPAEDGWTVDSWVGPLDFEAVVQGSIRHGATYRTVDVDAVASVPAAGDDPDADADAAAYDALKTVILEASAERAWELVLAVLRRSPDEDLSLHAAGPLEDLLCERATEVIDRIEAEAERDERFRWALGCVWLSHGTLPDEVLDRIVRASGGKIRPMSPLEELALEE